MDGRNIRTMVNLTGGTGEGLAKRSRSSIARTPAAS